MEARKINLEEKFGTFDKLWSPKIIGELNGQHLKIAKINGDFVMHQHENEDELFMVISGKLFLEMENNTLELSPGEIAIIPKGTMHKPYTKEETQILMFEPVGTLNTGDLNNEFTVNEPSKI